jgi:hypothetical protein
MRCRFSLFIVDIGKFLSRGYNRIKVVFTARVNLLQYQVYFVRV